MPVWAFGSPKGTNIMSDQDMPSVTVHSLRVERIERTKDAINLLQLSGSPTNGNSGGPVVDRAGRVLGVIEPKPSTPPSSFAIPSVRVNKMLAGRQPGTSATSIAQLFKQPIEGAKPTTPDPAPTLHRSDRGPIQTSGSYLNQMSISESDLEGWTAVQLTTLRNEPFARRGYIFRRADLRRIFARFDWYRPRTTNLNAVQHLLTKRESRNVDFIKSYQSSHGLGY